MYSVLIVGEEPRLRDELRACLPTDDPLFFICGDANNAEVGLRMARDLLPDIILADAGMLWMGVERFEMETHGDFPWMRMIRIVNSDAQPHDKDVLMRPVRPHQLRSALEEQIGKADRHRAGIKAELLRGTGRTWISEERARMEREAAEWLLGNDACPQCGMQVARYVRAARLYVPMSKLDTVSMLLHIAEARMDPRLCVKALRMPDSVLILSFGEDEATVEERIYRSANAALACVHEYIGEIGRILIGDCASTIGPDCLPEPGPALRQVAGRLILGTGDALRDHPTDVTGLTPMSELLPGATAEDLDGVLSYCERLSCADGAVVAAAARQLIAEVTGVWPDPADWPVPKDREEALRLLGRAIRERDDRAPGMRTNILSRMRAEVCRQMGNAGLNTATIAEILGVARSRLRVIFAQEMGITLTEYLVHLRGMVAERLLTGTNRRISSISAEVGCESVEWFIDRFSRVYGVTPRELRKRRAVKR